MSCKHRRSCKKNACSRRKRELLRESCQDCGGVILVEEHGYGAETSLVETRVCLSEVCGAVHRREIHRADGHS